MPAMKLWVPGKGLVGATLSRMTPCLNTGREVDIADLEQSRTFIRENKITHIVNCAAQSQVDLAEAKPEETFRSNALGPEMLGRAAQEAGAKLLHLSTDYVFDGSGDRLLTEEDPTNPCNVYGKTKLEGEQRLMAIMPEACILRTSWVFGRGGKNFVTKLLELLQTKNELRLVSDQTSRPTYVPDLAKAILIMLDRSGLYHFANAEPTNKYEFAKVLSSKMGLSCSIIPVSSSEFQAPAKRPMYSPLDTSKIGLPIRSWRDCLEEYLHEMQ